jgi:hypothetical protein
MADTTPSDLAVAFRSFARRLQDILSEASGDPAAARPHIDALTATVNDAAAQLGVSPGADLAATGQAVAARIAATPADKWDERILDAVRASALAAGGHLRQIEKAVSSRCAAGAPQCHKARPQPPQLSGLSPQCSSAPVDRVDEAKRGESAGPRLIAAPRRAARAPHTCWAGTWPRRNPCLRRSHERLALVDRHTPRGGEAERTHRREQNSGQHEPTVHEHRVVASAKQPHQHAQRGDAEVDEPGYATTTVVGELMRADERAGVEIGGQFVANFRVGCAVVSHGCEPYEPAARSRESAPPW